MVQKTRRDEVLVVRLTADEREQIAKLAALRGLTVSAFVRQQALTAAWNVIVHQTINGADVSRDVARRLHHALKTT